MMERTQVDRGPLLEGVPIGNFAQHNEVVVRPGVRQGTPADVQAAKVTDGGTVRKVIERASCEKHVHTRTHT